MDGWMDGSFFDACFYILMCLVLRLCDAMRCYAPNTANACTVYQNRKGKIGPKSTKSLSLLPRTFWIVAREEKSSHFNSTKPTKKPRAPQSEPHRHERRTEPDLRLIEHRNEPLSHARLQLRPVTRDLNLPVAVPRVGESSGPVEG